MSILQSFRIYHDRFMEYASHYDQRDGRIELKIIHTDHVVSIMNLLTERLHLPEHTRELAAITALFHDIGRFEQLRQYNTFLDNISVDHAELSVRVLKNEGFLKELPEHDQEKICTAISNHNKYAIDPALLQKEEKNPESQDLHELIILCRLIRDADKCDIFRVFAVDDMNDVIGASDEEVAASTITPCVLDKMSEHRSVDKRIRKTFLDFWISFLGFFFDFNYPESIRIAKEQGYYRVPFDRVHFKDGDTERQVRQILSDLEIWIEKHTVTVPDTLKQFFKEHPQTALAFSGGTDSAYLLYAAGQCGAMIHAYYVETPFQPRFERDDAERLVKSLHAELTVLPFSVLTDPQIRANTKDRCYYCKKQIFGRIRKAASDDGFPFLIDGTNASDDEGDRPGMRALRELNVCSPLRECGITKEMLRNYSRNAGLFTWKKPAYACLATRVPTGTEIEQSLLDQAEWAETSLFAMGFRDFRVRVMKNSDSVIAKLQLTEHDLPLLVKKRSDIHTLLKTRFDDVLLDLAVRPSSVNL